MACCAKPSETKACFPKQSDTIACSDKQPDTMSCCASPAKANKDAMVRESVKEHYGQRLQNKDDCQTGVNCLMDSSMPRHVRQALSQVHDDVTMKYFGCGPVIPEAVEGCDVLDLGSGSGRDCYALSKLVGPTGRVVGIDMTDEQLDLARKHIDYHRDKFGYSQSNVDFVFGYIEKLAEAGLQDSTFDIIISNCVINLSPDKTSVLKEAYRVLKEGGELYFSDVYADTYLSEELRQHSVLWGECVAGALHWQQLYQVAQEVGFSKPRLVTAKMVDVSSFSDILGDAKFVSVTYRLFKLPKTIRDASHVTYKGGILGSEDKLDFDRATSFKSGTPVRVDGELATILSLSRFSDFFTIDGAGPVTAVTADPKVDPFVGAEPATWCGAC